MSHTEQGFVAIEAAVIIPVLLIVSLLMVSVTARALETSSVTQSVAEEAARAASQQTTSVGATNAAQKIIEQSASNQNIDCQQNDLKTQLYSGGEVTVTVTCAGVSQLLPGFPSKTIRKTYTAREIVDVFRSGN